MGLCKDNGKDNGKYYIKIEYIGIRKGYIGALSRNYEL